MSFLKGVSTKRGLLPTICVLLFGVIMLIAFLSHGKMLEQEFDRLVEDNLTAYTQSQKNEVAIYIEEMRSTVSDLALLTSFAETAPDSLKTQAHLAAISQNHGRYGISYLSLGAFSDLCGNAGDMARLRMGESIVSDVCKNELTGGYSIYIASPVARGGAVCGVIYSELAADNLVVTTQTGPLRGSIESYIVRSDGAFVQLRPGMEGQCNLFDAYFENGGETLGYTVLEASLQDQSTTTHSFVAPDGKRIFISSTFLGYQDWNIINFADAADVAGYSQNIFLNSFLICALLVGLTMLLLAVIFYAAWRQQRELRISEQRYNLLARFSDTMLFEYEPQSDVLHWSNNADQIIQLPEQRLAGYLRERRARAFIHPDDVEAALEILRCCSKEGGQECFEVRILMRDSSYHWFNCQYETLYDHGMAILLVGKLTDITTHKEHVNQLQLQATTDSMTELLNNTAFREQMKEKLHGGESGFLFMIDVDDFKSINDTFGHAAGDAALHAVSDVLRQFFGEEDLVGRMGGDEFSALLHGAFECAAVEQKAETLLRAFAAVRLPDTPELRISVSIGIASAQSQTMKTLLASADHAMYHAKKAGKNAFYLINNET